MSGDQGDMNDHPDDGISVGSVDSDAEGFMVQVEVDPDFEEDSDDDDDEEEAIDAVGQVRVTVQSTAALAISTTILGVKNRELSVELEKYQVVETTPQPPTTTQPPINMDKYILPKNVIPISYDLYLYPHLETGLFDGKVTTTVDVKEETMSIRVHSNGLAIKKITQDDVDCKFTLDPDHELIEITTPKKLPVGSATFTIEYSGDMRNRIVGFYNSSYNENNVKKNIATSKFEPTYARQAFPCFDEPNMKANFTVHLLRPNIEGYRALSNMPQVNETPMEGGIMVHFQPSVRMSTYLTCFIVSDFTYTESFIHPETDNIPFRVYARPSQLDKTKFANQVGKDVIEYFIDYFQVKYPLPKLDLVAIPDFVSGAMEHWGLVTFRETSLLYDQTTSSTANKQRVAEVVAHELAHSWFGNLVTMNWWNDLWLNEGFATYIAAKGIDKLHNDWQMLDLFLTHTLHSVLSFDATPASHPIVVSVTTPDQITEIFDTISYNKGASILRMLENTVGPENFRTATTNYLKNHLYGNAITANYLDEMQKVITDNTNITQFMSTWTEQMGYPILTVKTEGENYVITQQQFLKQPENKDKMKPSKYNYKWQVPITYITSDNIEPVLVWFNLNDENVKIPIPKGVKWVKFNPNQVGYYRVTYEKDHWNALIKEISTMSTADKAHLLEESFSIAATGQSGQIGYDIPLSLTKYLSTELNYIPWSVGVGELEAMLKYLHNSEHYPKLQKYIITSSQAIYDKLQEPSENHLDKLAKGAVLGVMCRMGYEPCKAKITELFQNWLVNNKSIEQDLRANVYKYGLYYGTKDDWNKVWEKFVVELDAQEKIILMNALCHIQDPEVLTNLLELAKDDKYIRSQDYFSLLMQISNNRIGTPIVWDYVRENWPALVDRFTLNDRYLGRLIPSITSTFTTITKLEEMDKFFEKYPDAGAGAVARVQAVETVRNNMNWLVKNKVMVETWIQENVK